MFRFLYKKRSVRLASTWTEYMHILMISSVLSCLLYMWKPFDAWAERDKKTLSPWAQNITPYKLS